MSIPPLPAGLENTELTRAANALHSLSIHLLRRAREADRESGLSPERLSLLSILAYAGGQTVGRLAEMEQVSAPAISRIVSSLEKLGLAKRIRGEIDARAVMVEATEKGRRLVEKGRQRRLEIIAAELSRLNQRDIAALGKAAGILEKLETSRP